MRSSLPGALHPYLLAAVARRDLSFAEARDAMSVVLTGDASEAQIAAYAVALHMKGETALELAGFATAIREASTPVPFETSPGEILLDTCGTGGDGCGTFNISTAAAFVVAGCGVRVAKHGNRAVSGQAGSADVLEQLGLTITATPQCAEEALRTVGICFLYAPAFHPALRHAQAARAQLRMRTVFNLLGPLANPAPVNAQVVGAHGERVALRLASALKELGLARGYVVAGEDGLDEVTLATGTHVFEVREGAVRQFRLAPEDFGLAHAPLDAVRGGDAEANAQIIRTILDGERGARRDIVVANSALALMAAGKSASLTDCVEVAQNSIDTGAAQEKLRELMEKRLQVAARL